MSKYLKEFEQHSDYEQFTGTTEFIKPNVSLCEKEWDVHYNPKDIPVTGVTLDKTAITMQNGETVLLRASVLPRNATVKTLIWSSSDESVATVNEHGVVRGIGGGTAIITVKTLQGGYTKTCTVTNTSPIHVTGVTLTPSTLDIYKGNTNTLTATVLPNNASDKSVTWLSDNPSVATVDNNGVVSGVSVGNATITVTTVDGGFTAVCQVTVKTLQGLPLRFTAVGGNCNFSFSGNSIDYSLNDGPWTTLASETPLSVNANDKVMWKAELTPTSDGIGRFSSTGSFRAEGNPMSLLFDDNFSGQTSLAGKDYAFRDLFSGCTQLTSIDDLVLPATTLADYCYYGMFYWCKSLTSIPSDLLPATTMASYCYGHMFDNCKDLKSIPSTLLPSTTLADYCYMAMFSGCEDFTWAPSGLLPATALTEGCYQSMFAWCLDLIGGPDLPAPTLAVKCYQYMFIHSQDLNYIKCLATDISATDCTYQWYGFPTRAYGTFVKAASMPIGESGGWQKDSDNGIPRTWTVRDA